MIRNNNTNHDLNWCSPLPDCSWALPNGKYNPGGFGAKRPFSRHTGVDLFCEHNQPLAAVESGTIVGIRDFSKKKKPWLNRTRVILIEGDDKVVVYCNVQERKGLKIGEKVEKGEIIGRVIRINKKKRKKDTCMLHLEAYSHGTRKTVIWSYNFPKPSQLLDPTPYLVGAIVEEQIIVKRKII